MNTALLGFVLAAEAAHFDAHKQHLEFYLESAPHITLRASRDVKSAPVMVLDSSGLHAGATPLCTWPDRAPFDETKHEGMVLRSKADAAAPCAVHPVVSAWGDLGVGTAVLYVEIDGKESGSYRATCDKTPCWLDAKASSSFKLELSGDEIEASNRRSFVHLAKTDPSAKKFVADLRACLAGKDPRTCLPPLVDPAIDYPNYGPAEGRARLEKGASHADAWTTYVLIHPDLDKDLRTCVAKLESPWQASNDTIRVECGEFGYLVINKTKAGWQITKLGASD